MARKIRKHKRQSCSKCRCNKCMATRAFLNIKYFNLFDTNYTRIYIYICMYVCVGIYSNGRFHIPAPAQRYVSPSKKNVLP